MAFLDQHPVLGYPAAAGLGLLLGSFLNVVILRLPPWLEWEWRKTSREMLELPEPYEPAPPGIVVQGSACPKCGHKLAPWENIPVLSFALLRGKCRGCGSPISWQYPIVELATGLLFAACVWRFGAGPEALAAMVFTGFLVALAGIDHHRVVQADRAVPQRKVEVASGVATRSTAPAWCRSCCTRRSARCSTPTATCRSMRRCCRPTAATC